MNTRLVSVTPAIKAHPLWAGSSFESDFNFGGITVDSVRRWLETMSRSADLTEHERTFMMLWKAQIAGEAK